MKKLPAQYGTIITPFILSVFMSSIVSLVSTLRAFGFAEFQASTWAQAWGLSWLIAFPTLFAILPIVRKIAGLLVEKP